MEKIPSYNNSLNTSTVSIPFSLLLFAVFFLYDDIEVYAFFTPFFLNE